ncbi:WD40-repeat-containing domain protein [Phlyctochytrium arcticum]|nr:WD40-repeat-containing domain protein [Phlyctochytrium arcticum]
MCTLQIARRKHPKTNRVLPDMLYDVRVRTLGGKSLILVAGCGKAAVYEQKTVGRALQLRQQWSFEDQIPPVTETGIETTPERTRKGSESGTDEDGSQDEPEEEEPPDVYACDWALDVESRTAYACVGGWRGFLCVLVYQGWGNGALTDQKKSFQATRFLEGHGGSVNEIKTHPTETAFVLTASEDRSIRLWHAPSGRMCAIWVFGGVGETVRGGVLSVAWGKGGKEIVAGETDGIVRVWKADTPAVLRAMKHCTESPDPLSYSRHPSGSIIPGPSYLYDSSQVKSEEIVPMVAFETRPLWSSRWVFHDRIDWVAEFGGGYLAKGSKGGGEIRAFVPLLDRPHSTFSSDASVMILSRLTYGPKGPAHWFVRAALSPSSRFLSVGCRAGDAWVWDLPTLRETAPKAKDDGLLPPILRASKKLPRRIHKKLKPKSKERALEQCQIRAVSFSEDEKWMVGVSDQAWVRLWALTKKPVP